MNDLITSLKYLDGELDEKSLAAFKEELSVNQKLLEEVLLIKEINDTLSNIESLRYQENVQDAFFAYKNTSIVEKIKHLPIKRIYAVAATVIIFLGFSLYFATSLNKPITERIYNKYYQAYETDVFKRSSSSFEGGMTLAINEYEQGNYEHSLQLLGQQINDGKNVMAALFYSGLNYMETKQFHNAIDCFDKINNTDSVLKTHTLWYSGLARLAVKDINGAMGIFYLIADQDGYYKEKSINLIEKLKRI